MFLDDKLMEIWEESQGSGKSIIDVCQEMMDECTSRIPNPADVSVTDWINDVKRIDNGWRLFCKRNGFFKADAFKDVMMMRCGTDKEEYIPIYKELGWLKKD